MGGRERQRPCNNEYFTSLHNAPVPIEKTPPGKSLTSSDYVVNAVYLYVCVWEIARRTDFVLDRRCVVRCVCVWKPVSFACMYVCQQDFQSIPL